MKQNKEKNSHFSANTEKWRNAKRGGGIGMTLKVFGFLVAFSLIALAVVLVLQIGLLNQFYEQTKYDELERVDGSIQKSLDNGGDGLDVIIGRYSEDYLMCVRVFIVRGMVARQIASEDASGDCVIHRISDKELSDMCRIAAENDGLFIKQYVSENVAQESDGSDDDGVNINAVYIRLYDSPSGEEYIIMLNSELTPLSTTVQMLRSQFGTIALILLICSLILSFAISKNISRPIIQMNEAVKGLAKGNYNADFGSHGYREVIELSDTLESVAEELSQNDRLQKELIANISHDLRTPLTMITGYSEVMRDIPGENTPENVQVIIDETQRLSELVNDLLDLSKLQAGARKPELKALYIGELIRSTMGRYEKLTRHDGYNIEYNCTCDVQVLADKTMLLQVVYNLINNAINYTGEDKYVCVSDKLSADGRRVRISVSDSGEGISEDQLLHIWDRYYKVDKVHRRAMVGTGLGLSIVKNILEQHGAHYGAESKLGEGSTFWFELDVYNQPMDGETELPIDAEYVENK